jgi:N-methylhydantoinase A/oxoprolinase/acetone carboxylase beta subunit
VKYTLGIDIGGTNTDAVLIDENKKIITFAKTYSTNPVEEGFYKVLSLLLEKTDISRKNIDEVIIGTTHGINSILEKKNLYKVGLIRIAGQFPESIPPCFEWDKDLKSLILVDYVTINGGYECDGKKISSFNKNEAKQAIRDLIDKGAQSIAVISVFSPMYNDMEKECFNFIKKIAGRDFPVSLSHKIGGIGFIERENSTILNASLQKCLKLGFYNLEKILKQLKIKASLFFTQNNGSLLSLQQAFKYPILTICWAN